MSLTKNFSKIIKSLFFFGLCPFWFDKNSNKLKCYKVTTLYTCFYYAFVSIPLIYIAFTYHMKDGFFRWVSNTLNIAMFLQYTILILIFHSSMINSILMRRKHAEFCNKIIFIHKKFAKFQIFISSEKDLKCITIQHLSIVGFMILVNSVVGYFNRANVGVYQFIWNQLVLLQNISITLTSYYIRNYAIILIRGFGKIFQKIRKDVNTVTKCQPQTVTHYFALFDDLVDMKNMISDTFGVHLLFCFAYDFIIFTIRIYEMLVRMRKTNIYIFYFVLYNVQHMVKNILIVLALDKLASQVIIGNL